MEYKKLLAAGLAALMIAGCGSTSGGEGDASAKEDAPAEEAKAEETKPKEKPGVGETVTVDGAAITINSAETVDQVDDMVNTAANLEEGKKYVVIDMTIANDSDEELKISSMVSFELKNGDGRKQDYKFPVGTDGQMDGDIAPGDKLSGQLVYMADADGELDLKVTPVAIGGDSVIFKVR